MESDVGAGTIDWVRQAARERPDAPAVIGDGETLTYRNLDRAADGVASMVQSSGVRGESAVALWGERNVATVATFWGIARAGAAVVPVDPRIPPAVAMAMTARAGVRGLWTTPQGGIERLTSRVPEPVESSGPPNPDARCIVFTSGSEGIPQGVILTGDNVAASVAASRRALGNGPGDAWLAVLPLFHVGGLSILWRQAEAGAPVVLQDGFDAGQVADALQRVQFASLVPVMLRRVLAVDDRSWHGLRTVLIGGAAAPVELLEEARSRGIPAVPTYGMTETCSQIVTGAPTEPLDESVGSPLPGVELRVSADGEPVVAEPGRIEVKGPMVSPGYVDEEPRESEWLTTGDDGVLRPDGRLVVLGRADSVIVTGGENVHPSLVERAVAGHPGVEAVRVFGEPDDEWGERVVAEVVASATASELDEWSERLPPSHRPRRWMFVDRVDGKLA